MEGLLLAYLHLISGHGGKEKLLNTLLETYHIPHARRKASEMATACQACLVTNPLTGPLIELGTFPTPQHPYQVIFMDLLEGMPKNKRQIQYLFVITDYLTKVVHMYPLKIRNTEQILHFTKIFLANTGLATQFIYTDNFTGFRDKKFLQFLGVLKIRVPKTTPYRSQARGAVEIVNKQITAILTKLLNISPNYDFSDLYFLVQVLINTSYHSTIKTTPFKALLGYDPFSLGPMGLAHENEPYRSRLLTDDLRNLVTSLNLKYVSRLKDIKQEFEDNIEKAHQRMNRNRIKLHQFVTGDIVFAVNHTLPVAGGTNKLRPKLSKSPLIILDVHDVVVITRRLADGFEQQHHVNSLRKFKIKNELFNDLPDEVKEILGGPISSQELQRLAEIDELPLIYRDHVPASADPGIRTRAQRKEAVQLGNSTPSNVHSHGQDSEDDDEADDDLLPQPTVSFQSEADKN